jgi:hypothetical protein
MNKGGKNGKIKSFIKNKKLYKRTLIYLDIEKVFFSIYLRVINLIIISIVVYEIHYLFLFFFFYVSIENRIKIYFLVYYLRKLHKNKDTCSFCFNANKKKKQVHQLIKSKQ